MLTFGRGPWWICNIGVESLRESPQHRDTLLNRRVSLRLLLNLFDSVITPLIFIWPYDWSPDFGSTWKTRNWWETVCYVQLLDGHPWWKMIGTHWSQKKNRECTANMTEISFRLTEISFRLISYFQMPRFLWNQFGMTCTLDLQAFEWRKFRSDWFHTFRCQGFCGISLEWLRGTHWPWSQMCSLHNVN